MELLCTRLRITNIGESLDFFCNKLGLIEIGRSEIGDGRSIRVFLATPEEAGRAEQNDAPMLELAWSRDPEESGRGHDPGYVAYQVEDIYWLCHFLVRNGITINRPPRDGRMARVRSPDGHIVELWQQGNPREPMEPWVCMQDIDPDAASKESPADSGTHA